MTGERDRTRREFIRTLRRMEQHLTDNIIKMANAFNEDDPPPGESPFDVSWAIVARGKIRQAIGLAERDERIPNELVDEIFQDVPAGREDTGN